MQWLSVGYLNELNLNEMVIDARNILNVLYYCRVVQLAMSTFAKNRQIFAESRQLSRGVFGFW